MNLNSRKKSTKFMLQKDRRIFSGYHKTKGNKYILKFGKEQESFVMFEKKIAHRLFRFMHNFHYPKIIFLILLIFLSYFIFKNPLVNNFFLSLNELSYLGVFLAGILFALGFTTPFAVGFFIAINPPNIFFAGIIGGLGALISNLLVFKFIQFSFLDEFYRLEHTKIIQKTAYFIENHLGHRIRLYLLYIFAGILIASPLPDEAGVILISGLTKINVFIFSVVTFALSTLGITLLLMI